MTTEATSNVALAVFDETIRQRDAAFCSGDLATTMSFYRADAVEIDPSGALHVGRAAIEKQLGYVFGLGLVSKLRQLTRSVDPGRGLATLVLDSVFESGDGSFRQHFLTAQTFTLESGRWLLLLSTNTMLPE